MILELIYTSMIGADASPSCIGDVLRTATSFNRANDITGLLLFDGERFCQLIEGETDGVVALTNRIERDPRHHDFRIVQQVQREGGRRFPNWNFAWVTKIAGELPELLAQLERPDRVASPDSVAAAGIR